MDIKKAMDAARDNLELTIKKLTLPSGAVLEDVTADTPEEVEQLQELLAAVNRDRARESKRAASEPPYLSHAVMLHLDDLKRAGREPGTVSESRHCLSVFMGVVGQKRVNEITTDDCRAYLDAAANWPARANVRPEYAGLSVLEIIEKGKQLGEKKPAQVSINKFRQRLSVFITFLLENEFIEKTPLKGIARPDKFTVADERRRPFSQDELDAVFEPERFLDWAKAHPHRWWGPILGLYTGARVNEIAQLYVRDVETVHDVPGLHIRKTSPGQKLKTHTSLRFIPLHPKLIELGFLDYVEDVKRAGHERLFPHLPNDGNGFGKQLSRRFATYVEACGITEEGVAFHAFRHTLATRLSRVKPPIPEGTIARITGHGTSGGTLPAFYIDPPTLPERASAIAQFEAGVSLPKYRAGQFDAQLQEAHELPAKWAAEKRRRTNKRPKAEGGA